MPAVLSAIVALACILASGRRLKWAVEPTGLDPGLLREVLSSESAWSSVIKLRDATSRSPETAWEHGLLSAFTEPEPAVRDGLVSEQLTDLEGRLQRWGRVPRVCASIATSAGFLFASITLIDAVASPVPAAAEGLDAGLVSAVNALAIGLSAASFCVAVHVRARRAFHQRLAVTGCLVARLRALAAEAGEAASRTTGPGVGEAAWVGPS